MPAFPKPTATETDPVAGPNLTTHTALTTTAHGGIVASDDARLTNARTPTAHKTTHATGQSDAIAPSDIGAATAAAAAAAQSTADGAVVLADTKVPKSDIDTDSTFAANSDTKVPSQKAVKAALAAIDLTSLVTLSPATAARNTVQPSSAAAVPLTVKGAAAQSVNLTEFQSSAGTVLAAVGNAGRVMAGQFYSSGASYLNTLESVAAGGPFVTLSTSPATVKVENRTTVSNVVLTVKGMASQSGNLQEWKNSAGTVLAKVDSGGALTATSVTSTGQIEIVAAGVGIKLKSPDGATTKTLTIDNAGALALV